MKLVIVHYHFRPGGVRRVIEMATPYLVRCSGIPFNQIVVAAGEAEDRKWNSLFRERVAGVPVEFFLEPVMHYISEQRTSAAALARRIRSVLDRLLDGGTARNCLVWAHNLSIGRNLILARELARACAHRGILLVSHHHDWWFDNRWLRWPEMRRYGFPNLRAAAAAVFPSAGNVRHVSINHAEARLLEGRFPKRSGWLPNMNEPAPPPSKTQVAEAKAWLAAKLAHGAAPVWIVPCRLLRRKNLAEALLLARWLRPEAWLVTTGGVSSPDEQEYADALSNAAHRHHWRLRLAVLQGDESRKPGVADLLAASEAVLLTSIQEGFGLPYLEAASARRPLIARRLPGIAGDLTQFGFDFPYSYRELLMDPRLFDWPGEVRRQKALFHTWREGLPRSCRRWLGEPALLSGPDNPRPVPFSRLTLTAQLEVLAQPVRLSWMWSSRLNPFLVEWKKRAQCARLEKSNWPPQADRWLSGPAYAARFGEIMGSKPGPAPGANSGLEIQRAFLRDKLSSEHLFPLLWARET